MNIYKIIVTLLAISMVVLSCTKDMQTSTISKSASSAVDLRNSTDNSRQYTIWQVKDQAYTLIFNTSGSYKNIWMIQQVETFTSESINQVSNGSIGLYDNSYLKLSYDGGENVYALAENVYKDYSANAIGLITFVDDDLLGRLRSMTESTKDGIIDDVSEKATCKEDGTSDRECKCAGGHGASACECSGSIASVSWHESVTCKTGYFACCPGL